MPKFFLSVSAALLMMNSTAAIAHVQLNSPNGGETFVAGSVVSIEWEVAVEHGPVDWDLRYSTTGPEGDWIDILADIDATILSHDWLVPELGLTTNAWVQVIQDNQEDIDYDDASDSSFTILTAASPGDFDGNGVVSGADLGNWQTGYGLVGTATAINGDANSDNSVTGADLLLWQRAFAPAPPVTAIPEPSTASLALFGVLLSLGAMRVRQLLAVR